MPYSPCFPFSEFDYTAATGLGALRNELDAKKVPLVVLGASNEVQKMLKETLKSTLLEASNEEELESVLQELCDEGKRAELREVVCPLLSATPEHQKALDTVDEE